MDGKSFRISKFYVGIYIAGLVILLSGGLVGFIIKGPLYAKIILWVVSGVCTMLSLYQMLLDFQAGTFSINAIGITMRIGLKSYLMKWEDCKSFGIADVRVEQGASTFWVYCAQRPLSGVEKQKFLSKTRRDLSLVHYFQYSKEPFEEMLKYIPEREAQYLRDQVARIQMNPIEKLYHRK